MVAGMLGRAFATACRLRPDLHLEILGDGPERPKREALVGRLDLRDRVSLPGLVHNRFSHMARADVFVLSSRCGGVANVLAEALACGTEVVSNDRSIGPREVLDTGRSGRLVPVRDADAMAHAMPTAVRKRRAEPALVGPWLRQYDLSIVAERYLEIMGTP